MPRLAACAVVLLAVAAVGCATVSPSGQPVGPANTKMRHLKGAAGLVSFTACGRTPADPASTHLKAIPLPSAAPETAGYDVEVPSGRVVLEHAIDLVLTDGMLTSGNGYQIANGVELEPVRVAPSTVTAPVTLAVLESPQSGRRVAFVEVRIDPEPPIRWDEEPGLHIGTDGGDGGFATTDAKDVSALNPDYPSAFSADDGKASHTCVLRQEGGKRPDGVLFSTGYGDGGYPTLVGRAADGRVVSIVSYGFVVPWRLSGLPGTPPREVVEQEQTRR